MVSTSVTECLDKSDNEVLHVQRAYSHADTCLHHKSCSSVVASCRTSTPTYLQFTPLPICSLTSSLPFIRCTRITSSRSDVDDPWCPVLINPFALTKSFSALLLGGGQLPVSCQGYEYLQPTRSFPAPLLLRNYSPALTFSGRSRFARTSACRGGSKETRAAPTSIEIHHPVFSAIARLQPELDA